MLNTLVETVRPTGALGVVGLYVPQDPAAPDEHASRASCCSRSASSSRRACGWAPGRPTSRRYNRQLRDLIIAGRAKPSFVVRKELPLDEAPDAYQRFDRREAGYTKVVLKPAA